MVLNLKQLYEFLGEKTEFDYVVSPDKLAEIRGYSFTRDMQVTGKAYNRAGILFLDYDVTFGITAECDRCLESFQRDYSFSTTHILVRSVSDGDSDEYIITEGDKLDLDDAVISDVLLQIPTKLLCKEDCKGLCMHCGVNLNNAVCDCEKQ